MKTKIDANASAFGSVRFRGFGVKTYAHVRSSLFQGCIMVIQETLNCPLSVHSSCNGFAHGHHGPFSHSAFDLQYTSVVEAEAD